MERHKKKRYNSEDTFVSFWIEKRQKFMKLYQERDFDAMHSELFEILVYSMKNVDFDIVLETLLLMGEFYLFAGKPEQALFAFSNMKLICDSLKSYEMKARSIIGMAGCLQMTGDLERSISFLKKAIEYSWAAQDEDLEAEIYDLIGKAYFNMVDSERAAYYHNRSLDFKTESSISPARVNSKAAFGKIHLQPRALNPYQMLSILIIKLGMNIQEEKEDGFMSPSRRQQKHQAPTEQEELVRLKKNLDILKSRKLTTNFSIETQLENIMSEPEFSYTIPSPRYPEGVTENEINDVAYRWRERDREKSVRVLSIRRQMKKKDPDMLKIEKEISNKPMRIKDIMEPIFLNISMEEKINLRMKKLEDMRVAFMKLRAKFKGALVDDRPKFYLNHKAPSRELAGFNHFFVNNISRVRAYFRKLILKQEEFVDMGAGAKLLVKPRKMV